MTSRRHVALVESPAALSWAALAAATTACAPEPAPCVLDPSARTAIEAIERESVTAARTGTLETILPSYAPDAEMMPPNAPTIRGREAIRAAVADLPPVTKYDVIVEAIDGCQDFAVAKGRYDLAVQLGDSATIEDSGRFLHVFRRTDGEWLIAYDIFSSDRPLP